MRSIVMFGTAVLACFLLSGCIQSDTVIRVKSDGSGIVEETMKISNEVLESLQNMSTGMKTADAGEPGTEEKAKVAAPDLIQAMMKDARLRVAKYGPGVKFLSAAPVKTDTMSGYKAVYAFKDINELRISQNPESKTRRTAEGNEGQAKTEGPSKRDEVIRFTFVKGPVSKLTVTMPETDKRKKPAEKKKEKLQEEGATDPDAAEMMKALFKDLSIRIALEIEGEIVETNSMYREGSQLTLFDMHFGKLLENTGVFARLNEAQPKTVGEMKEYVKDIEGLKIEMNNPVVVMFR